MSSLFELAKTKPTPVHASEVTKYYLSSELSRLVKGDQAAQERLAEGLADLSDPDALRLLEGLSDTFRVNGTFQVLANQAFDWYRTTLPIDNILMGGVNPRIDRVIKSDAIDMQPARFAHYLDNYFTAHVELNDDPQGLNEFRPQPEPTLFPTIITREKARTSYVRVIDGNHRLVHLAMRGVVSIETYTAVANGEQPSRLVGSSTIRALGWLLRQHTEDPIAKNAILSVVQLLAEDTMDAESQLEAFWSQNPILRLALDELKQHNNSSD